METILVLVRYFLLQVWIVCIQCPAGGYCNTCFCCFVLNSFLGVVFRKISLQRMLNFKIISFILFILSFYIWPFINNDRSFIITKKDHNDWVLKSYWYTRRKKEECIRMLYLHSKCNECMVNIYNNKEMGG